MDEKNKRLFLLGEEKLSKALLKLGIPTMIGMIVSALYSIVDAFFVGRLGTSAITAVTVVYPVTMIGTGIGLLFGSGAGSYLARLLGTGDYKKVEECASTVIVSGIITATIMVSLMLLFFTPLMKAMGATPDVMTDVKAYGYLFIGGLVFNIFSVMVNNMIVAEGASGFSMFAMLVGGISNIILCPICIYGLRMGIEGASLATFLARLLSAGLYVFYLCGGKTYMKLRLRAFRPTKELYKEVFKVGIPLLVFQFLSSFTMSITNIAAKSYGTEVIAAMGIVNRIVSLESMALFGFLKGYQPLVGYNYGAKNIKRTKEATSLALKWSTAACVIFGLICIIFSKQVVLLFNTESARVLMVGQKALILTSLSYMTLGIQIVYGTYFLAIGRAKEGGILSICRQGVFFLPAILILPKLFGLNGLVCAQLFADVCSVTLTILFIIRERKKERYVECLSKA
jgi:putative MATE family efflux protein